MWYNENSGENERGKIPVGDRLAFPADSKSQEGHGCENDPGRVAAIPKRADGFDVLHAARLSRLEAAGGHLLSQCHIAGDAV